MISQGSKVGKGRDGLALRFASRSSAPRALQPPPRLSLPSKCAAGLRAAKLPPPQNPRWPVRRGNAIPPAPRNLNAARLGGSKCRCWLPARCASAPAQGVSRRVARGEMQGLRGTRNRGRGSSGPRRAGLALRGQRGAQSQHCAGSAPGPRRSPGPAPSSFRAGTPPTFPEGHREGALPAELLRDTEAGRCPRASSRLGGACERQAQGKGGGKGQIWAKPGRVT